MIEPTTGLHWETIKRMSELLGIEQDVYIKQIRKGLKQTDKSIRLRQQRLEICGSCFEDA